MWLESKALGRAHPVTTAEQRRHASHDRYPTPDLAKTIGAESGAPLQQTKRDTNTPTHPHGPPGDGTLTPRTSSGVSGNSRRYSLVNMVAAKLRGPRERGAEAHRSRAPPPPQTGPAADTGPGAPHPRAAAHPPHHNRGVRERVRGGDGAADDGKTQSPAGDPPPSDHAGRGSTAA